MNYWKNDHESWTSLLGISPLRGFIGRSTWFGKLNSLIKLYLNIILRYIKIDRRTFYEIKDNYSLLRLINLHETTFWLIYTLHLHLLFEFLLWLYFGVLIFTFYIESNNILLDSWCFVNYTHIIRTWVIFLYAQLYFYWFKALNFIELKMFVKKTN